MAFGINIPGITWNSWYNPLDNVASAGKQAIPVFGQQNGKQTVTSLSNAQAANKKPAQTGGYPQVVGGASTVNNETPASWGGSSGGGSGSGYTAEDLAAFDAQEGQLRSLLARTGTTLNQGLSSLGDDYNRNVSGANTQRSRALENYGIQREDSARGKQEAIGKVDTNARTLNDSLRRILGMASGSNSSAYQLAAPNAVARQASQQRSGVLGDYAENDRDVTLAENRAKSDFEQLLEDLARQRNQREQELRSGVLESESDIQSKLATIAGQRAAARGGGVGAIRAAQQPFQNEINNRQSQLDSLFEKFRSPMLTPKAVNVQTPQLRDYMVDRATIGQDGTQGQYEPYSNFLRQQRDEEEQLV